MATLMVRSPIIEAQRQDGALKTGEKLLSVGEPDFLSKCVPVKTANIHPALILGL